MLYCKVYSSPNTYILYWVYIITIMEIIGTSKIAAQKKITLVDSVFSILNATIGDRIAYIKNTSGDIIIKKLSDIEMKD